jgi:hypothetical protein
MDVTAAISEIAHRVRRIAEEISPTIDNALGAFPAGWRQDCSRALGQLLEDSNLR